ncbi:acyltransferase family protein [Ancylobacter terrae]|uniref:acyltransferase family protein n=1 Tax=Ancylobacter sp. sgz301288 TaxID=3342077 RepID=UPI00385BA761
MNVQYSTYLNTNNGNRIGYIDSAKGVAIICVLLIHSVTFTTLNKFDFEQIIATIFRQIIDFPVGVFFGIAGFLVGKAALGGKPFPVLRRIGDLLLPYVIATVVFITIRHHAMVLNVPFVLGQLATGRGIDIGYFVIVMLQMTLLTPVILGIGSTRAHIAIMASLSIAGIAYSYSMKFLGVAPLDQFPWSALPFFVWYPFYHLGLFLGMRPQVVASLASPRLFVVAGLALAASIAEAFVLRYGFGLQLFASQIKATSIAYTIALLLIVISGEFVISGLAAALLETLGASSYFIYLYHLLLLPRIGRHVAAVVGEPTLAALISTAITLSVFLVVIYLANRLVPARLCRRVFGIGALSAPTPATPALEPRQGTR